MSRDHRGASGEIELIWDWWESGSGHREQESTTKLVGNANVVELKITSSDSNAIKATSDRTYERYAIPVEELVNLIKKNGERLHHPE